MDKIEVTGADNLSNLKHRADLLRREGTYSGVWFADTLLEAADDLDLLRTRLSTPTSETDDYTRGLEDAAQAVCVACEMDIRKNSRGLHEWPDNTTERCKGGPILALKGPK